MVRPVSPSVCRTPGEVVLRRASYSSSEKWVITNMCPARPSQVTPWGGSSLKQNIFEQGFTWYPIQHSIPNITRNIQLLNSSDFSETPGTSQIEPRPVSRAEKRALSQAEQRFGDESNRAPSQAEHEEADTPQPCAPPLPGPDATTIPAVRNHHPEPAGGPLRWRGGGPGGRNAVLPEPYGYAALATIAALSGRRDTTTTTAKPSRVSSPWLIEVV